LLLQAFVNAVMKILVLTNYRNCNFSTNYMHHGVFIYCDVTSVSKVGVVAFLFFTPGPPHLVKLYSCIEIRTIDGN
jgi:hypothetical protein